MTKPDIDSNATASSDTLAESNNGAVNLGPVELRVASRVLLGRLPENDSDFKALGFRVGRAGRKRAYTGYYMRAILNGKHFYTSEVMQGAEKLIAEIMKEPHDPTYKAIQVLVPNGLDIPSGTIILRGAITCICGVSFVPTIWNQINHTSTCAKKRASLRKSK